MRTLAGCVRRVDGQLAAEFLVPLCEFELEWHRFVVSGKRAHGFDGEIARIQDQACRARVFPVERKRCVAAQFAPVEIDRKIEIDVRDAHHARLGIGVRIGGKRRSRQCEGGEGHRGKQSHWQSPQNQATSIASSSLPPSARKDRPATATARVAPFLRQCGIPISTWTALPRV